MRGIDFKDAIQDYINLSLTISEEKFLNEINNLIKEGGSLPAYKKMK